MNKRFVTHDTFVIERTYDASPAQVFAAWSNPETKKNWFQKANEFDFRVGGRESMQIGPPGGPIFTFAAFFRKSFLISVLSIPIPWIWMKYGYRLP